MPELTTDDGARIVWRVDGRADAPPVLLAHALGTTHAMWEPQLAALAQGFMLVRWDARGHGASSVPPGPYGIERLARDALAVMDAQGLERAAFAGLSLGGMVGMWLGINAPERLTRLALCDTYARNAAPAMWDERIATVRAHGMAAIADASIDRWLTKGFQALDPATTARIRAMLLACDPAGYCAGCAAVRDTDLLDELGRITAPTLLIDGRHDQATRPDAARAMLVRLPDARLIELEAAHLSNIEAAAAFTRALASFLEP